MKRMHLLVLLLPFLLTVPAYGQSADGTMGDMPGMTMPMDATGPKQPAAAGTHAGHDMSMSGSKTQPAPRGARDTSGMHGMPGMGAQGGTHAGHNMNDMPGVEMHRAPGGTQGTSGMPGMGAQGGTHAGHNMNDMPGVEMHPAPGGTQGTSGMPGMGNQGGAHSGHARPMGNEAAQSSSAQAAPPPPPADHAADRHYDPERMAAGRKLLRNEQGGQTFYMVLFNLAEYQVRKNRDGFRWDGEGWFGGDLNRLWLKSEGEGDVGRNVGSAEIQALYSRAVGPYTDLQGGIRYDIKPNPSRTYATVGFETLAPFFFEAEGALFLSNKGDLLGRLEGYFDQRITQRLILQPRVELNLAAQDVRATDTGRGLSDAELGLRLRYEIRREFAPYIGVSWERKVGHAADFAHDDGEEAGSLSFVTGIRFWF